MKITVTHDDGTTQDITELVQIAYDVATHSMDWGSGFLDIEETAGLCLLADACRFPSLDEVLVEEWRNRMAQGKKRDELNRIARERGTDYWFFAKPTAEEKARMLDGMRSDVTRYEGPDA